MVWMILDSSVTIASKKQGMFLSLKNCKILLDKTQKKGYKKEVLFILFYRQETQTLKWLRVSQETWVELGIEHW